MELPRGQQAEASLAAGGPAGVARAGAVRPVVPLVVIGLMIAEAISLLGSEFSSLGFGVHAFEESQQALRFSLVLAVSLLVGPMLMPVWGLLADRGHARTMLVLGDLGAALVTAVACVLAGQGQLSYPLLFVAVVLAMTSQSMCQPAANVLVSRLVPPTSLERVNGMMQIGPAVVMVVGPTLAAPLYGMIGLPGLLAVDVGSAFLAAITVLIVVPAAAARLPLNMGESEPTCSRAATASSTTRWYRQRSSPASSTTRWHRQRSSPSPRRSATMSARSARLPSLADLLRQQPGLRGLIWFSGVDGLCFGAVSATLTPLALTIYDERMLGVILAAAGLGALAGGVLTMVLGDKWLGIRGFLVAQVMVGLGLVGVAADKSPAFLAVVAFVVMAATSLCIAVETTLIQRHTPRAGLGRMLGRAGLIRGLGVAVGILGAGALADMLLEPGLRPGGALSGWSVFTWWGLGPGQGYRSLFVLAGLGALAALLIFIMHGGWRALLPSAASTTPPRDD